MNEGDPPLDRILLVPGFMSPGWMFAPLHRALNESFACVEVWDHPTVFDQPAHIAAALAAELNSTDDRLGIISHSFGDWIVRGAIASTETKNVRKLISICPVATSVPTARLLSKFSLDVTPELQLMGDELRASAALNFNPSIDHLVLWATFDVFVFKPLQWPRAETEHRSILGTHNSILFQPNIWRIIKYYLSTPVG
jgi:pimeloyl-ACP methyl ester carboxylesterase